MIPQTIGAVFPQTVAWALRKDGKVYIVEASAVGDKVLSSGRRPASCRTGPRTPSTARTRVKAARGTHTHLSDNLGENRRVKSCAKTSMKTRVKTGGGLGVGPAWRMREANAIAGIQPTPHESSKAIEK